MRQRAAFLAALLAVCVPLAAQQKTDFSQFLVMGEGLAAGFTDFQLREVGQANSFPALIARQMGIFFPQPLIQSPGIGYVPGFPILPVRAPNTLQTTLRVAAGPVPNRENGQPPQNIFIFNTSVPNMTVAEALTRKPQSPLIQNDVQQTTINLILGFPGMVVGPNMPVWTQLEYVQQMNPTYVLLALGYSEAVRAAASGDPGLLPDVSMFRTNYAAILSGLKETYAPVLIVNIPDPTDTAFFSTLTAASDLLLADPETIQSLYKLKPDDQITIPGLVAMANQMNVDKIGALPAGSIVSGSTISAIRAGVTALNAEIAKLAQQNGSPLYDVRALFSRMRTGGLVANGQGYTANFMGGLYSFCGFYPGATVHAAIANDLLTLINTTYGTNYPLLRLDDVAAVDPITRVTTMGIRRGAKPEVRR